MNILLKKRTSPCTSIGCRILGVLLRFFPVFSAGGSPKRRRSPPVADDAEVPLIKNDIFVIKGIHSVC